MNTNTNPLAPSTTAPLSGRTALVTGGSRGIGAATALRLARDGADVALTYVNGEDAAGDVVRAVETLGRRAVALRADSADADEAAVVSRCAAGIASGSLLRDPLELRPLPLSGIPGWHPDNDREAFHRMAACYQPLREGRRYPRPVSCATDSLS